MVQTEMKADEIHNWDSMARYRFTYVPDGAQDTWRDHSAEVLANADWTGDCDDLAHTVLALCIKGGAAMSDCYRMVVKASSDGAGHMVAAIEDDAGAWWIIGDTFYYAYPADQMAHTPMSYNRMSEAGPGVQPLWRAGVPWLPTVPKPAS